jgi:hypothetical protein
MCRKLRLPASRRFFSSKKSSADRLSAGFSVSKWNYFVMFPNGLRMRSGGGGAGAVRHSGHCSLLLLSILMVNGIGLESDFVQSLSDLLSTES